MWIINCLLLMLGSVSAVLGISFYFRNRQAAGKTRFYILFYGLCSAVWCICYGMIGISDNLELCEQIRKVGVAGINGFLLTEVFLVSEMSGAKKSLIRAMRVFAILIAVTDFLFFARSKVDMFIRKRAWTTWTANPDGDFNRTVHAIYIGLIFCILILFGINWIINNKLRRLKRFLFMVFVSNFIMLFFTLPDTFIPAAGMPAISTSGLGAAACTIVMWYGATQLNSFDIRTGNIKDRLFDFLEAGIIIVDTDFRIAMVNRYASQLAEKTELVETTLSDFFDIDEEEQKKCFLTSMNEIYSARLWNKTGTRAYSVRVKSVEDDYGDPFCYMCVFLDVTEEVEAASKLEIASQAKSRFLAQMSHEIRTPINAVLGMNEMILREAKEESIQQYAENIDSAGNTLLTLINSILDFSKIEDGKMDIVPVQYSFASVINNLVNSVYQRADVKGLKLNVEIDKNIPSVLIGDDVRVSQVIMNLLTNAVKYTQKGSVAFTVKVEDIEGENVRLFVSVADTGIGIHEEDIDKLFVSFERLDEVKNHNIEGTGLGISIVKSLLSMMGSELRVESTYGKGSIFSFVITQQIADATPVGDYEERIRESHQKKENNDLIDAPAARILVVDDNDMNQKVSRNFLKLCNIRPDVVSSGMEAIEIMRKNTYDCVFLDHMMPGMDGIETLHQLMKEGLVPDNTVMIALTANAVVGAREAYLKEGFADYLSKPIVLKELVKILGKYLPERAYGKNELEINREEGIMYCAGDEEFYAEMLKEFASNAKDKTEELNGLFQKKDWENYRVQIHAAKSVLRTLGAVALSEKAKELEFAAKNGDVEFILNNHAAMMEYYLKLADKITPPCR
ncbi:MAG: response regulator [Lachnospiraceae bacterium]|nr:response regulator [Lachnospiraceae bacterium]